MKRPPAILALLTACAGPAAGPAADTGRPAPEPWTGELVVDDAHGFSYEAHVEIASTTLSTGGGVVLDWSTLGEDMLGHALDPAQDLDAAFITVWEGLTPEQLSDFVARDELPQAELSLFVRAPLEPGQTALPLADFTMMGTDIGVEQYFKPGSGTWMAALASEGPEVVAPYRKLLFLDPRDHATETIARVADGSSRFTVQAELDATPPLRVPAGETFPVDWSGLTTDGLGRTLALHKLDRLSLAWYADANVAELEADFVDLDLLADAMWDLDVEGVTRADLAAATGATGGFEGFTPEGTWLLALRCGSCNSPMPLFISPVDVRP